MFSLDSFLYNRNTIYFSIQEFSFDDLKIRFTLLKHRKELRTEDRIVIAQVKDVWESLYNVG